MKKNPEMTKEQAEALLNKALAGMKSEDKEEKTDE